MTEIIDNKVILSDEDWVALNSFIGFGDLTTTDVLFFGIEEGLGPLKVDDMVKKHLGEVKLRVDYLNKDTNLYLDGQSIEDGYSTSGYNTELLREQCYRELDISYSTEKLGSAQYVSFVARILLALSEEDDDESLKFFSKSREIKEKVRKRLSEGICGRSTGKRCAITDWRPLPRQKVGNWYYGGVEDDYINAFEFKPSIAYYEKLRDKRLDIYKNLFSTHHIPVIISIGERKNMRNLFCRLFGSILENQSLIFSESFLLEKTAINWGKASFPVGETLIICIDHFNYIRSYKKMGIITQKIRQLLRGKENNKSTVNIEQKCEINRV